MKEFRKKPFKINPQTSKKFANKVKKKVQLEYGLVCTAEEASDILNRVAPIAP